jgi:hypothetical protein
MKTKIVLQKTKELNSSKDYCAWAEKSNYDNCKETIRANPDILAESEAFDYVSPNNNDRIRRILRKEMNNYFKKASLLEKQIMSRLCDKDNDVRSVAKSLGIAKSVVHYHIQRIRKKLDKVAKLAYIREEENY